MSSESKVVDLERRVNELEETTKRQFNLTVMGIVVAVTLSVMLNYMITPADIYTAESLKLLGDRVHNLAVHTGIPNDKLNAAPPRPGAAPEATAVATPVETPAAP